MAEAFGCTGMRCADKTTLVEQMREALDDRRARSSSTSRVTEEENVYPMISPGAAARDMEG